MPPMFFLLLGPIGLTVLLLAAFLPYRSFRVAARNGKVGNERSSRRTRREMRHAKRFLRSAVLVPLLIVVLIQGALFCLHFYLVPDTTLSDLFGAYHPEVALHAPDLEAWDEAIEAKRRDQAYREWQQAEGLLPESHPTIVATLIEHWPIHLVIPLFPLAFLAWFMTRHFFNMSQRYHHGVVRRSKRYALHGAAGGARAPERPVGYASPPGMLKENLG